HRSAHGPHSRCRQRSCTPLRYGLPSVSPVKIRVSRVQLPQSVWEGNGPLPIGSFGRPIIPDPAGQAFLADLARGEGEDDGRGMRRLGRKGYVVAAQENHHGVERDTLVAVHEGMVTSQTEGVG